MEIFLLVFIILFLVFRLKAINHKLDDLQIHFNLLREAVGKMRFQQPPATDEKPIVQEKVVPKEEKTEPVIVPEPVAPEKSLERPEQNVTEVFEAAAVMENHVEEQIRERKVEKPRVVPNPVYQKTWWEKFREQNPDLEKFVGENLISKIGILILVLGISYFVKFAIDKDWINETARVGIGILCGAILLGVAHKLRVNFQAFSSVLVAGAIAVLYFTIAIAFHQYHIFSQTVAFVLMVIITAFSVLISVSYNRMELAILSLIGGFAVPFMLSTGEGNYQVLFTYIAILDIGILAIAYLKRWSLVNILAFVFTLFLFGGWLATKVLWVGNGPHLGALLFGSLFYLIFTFVNIINNLRTKETVKQTELIILVVNTFLYFSAGMLILQNFHPEYKGVFTIALAVLNLVCAWVLFKKFGLDKNAIYLFIGLTLTFVTLSIPLQFSGNYITLFWAAEAVLLVWLAQKSQIHHFRFASVIVHLLMLGSLFMDWSNVYLAWENKANLFLNEGFIAGIFASTSLFLVYYVTKNENLKFSLFQQILDTKMYGGLLKIASLIVLYSTGLLESKYQSKLIFNGPYSPTSITILYHLIFSFLLIFWIQKTKKESDQRFAIVLSMVNIGLYILYFSSIPLGELRDNIDLKTTHTIAFVLHYFSLASLLYQGFVIWKDGKTKDSLSLFHQEWFIWAAAFALVYITSNELLLHGGNLIYEPAPKMAGIYFDSSIVYSKALTSVVKVGFPILWGLLAILFLTIGIKKQLRNLRIVALSLLGLTIVKLFVYDISNASETGKIIAFILLGIMILVMSFAYQKIKKIVLENEQTNEPERDEK